MSIPVSVLELAAIRHGIVTADDLLGATMSRHEIRRLVRARSLISIHRGVYHLANTLLTFHARCAAACLADDEAVVTGRAAARIWNFRHVPTPRAPEVLVRHDRTPITRGVLLRRTNVLDASDIVERTDAIRVVSPPRAWFDCAVHLDDDRFERLTEWVLDHHCSVSALFSTARRLDARGRPGLARVNRVLSRREAWQRPAQSGLEVIVLRGLEARHVGPLVRQHPIRLPNGVMIHADGADPARRWAIEIDHVTWHGGRFEAQRDKARDRQCRKIGWTVERITDQEVRDDLESTLDDIADSYHRHAGRLSA